MSHCSSTRSQKQLTVLALWLDCRTGVKSGSYSYRKVPVLRNFQSIPLYHLYQPIASWLECSQTTVLCILFRFFFFVRHTCVLTSTRLLAGWSTHKHTCLVLSGLYVSSCVRARLPAPPLSPLCVTATGFLSNNISLTRSGELFQLGRDLNGSSSQLCQPSEIRPTKRTTQAIGDWASFCHPSINKTG